MAITGALAAAARVFDPYPEAILALDFAGVRTGGRQFYKREGIIVPRFEMLRGASSVGHAGFGRAEVNGAWRAFAPDAPLIGDGGLMVPESKGELVGLSCRPADAGWLTSGGAKSTGTTHRGVYRSARHASAGQLFHRLSYPNGTTVVSGQLYTVIARFKAGTSGNVYVQLRNPSASTFAVVQGAVAAPAVDIQTAGSLNIVANLDEGDGYRQLVMGWTPNFTGIIDGGGIGPFSVVAGEDIEVLGLSIQAGPYVGNPPIDNENLPATRPAVAQSVGGVGSILKQPFAICDEGDMTPGDYERYFWTLDDLTPNNRISFRRTWSGVARLGVINGGEIVGVGATVIGTGYRKSCVKVESGLIKAWVDGVQVATATVTTPGGLSRIKVGHSDNQQQRNGRTARLRVLGAISDAEAAGLSA